MTTVTADLFLAQAVSPKMAKRYAEVWNMREAGSTFSAIGQAIGVSGSYANHILHIAEHLRSSFNQKEWYFGLSTRARNVLGYQLGYTSKDAIKRDIIAKKFELRKIRHVGPMCRKEILEWLNLPLDADLVPHANVRHSCPNCNHALRLSWRKSGATVGTYVQIESA